MTVKEKLIKAKALIDSPEKWCQESYSRDGKFCMVGALNAFAGQPPYDLLVRVTGAVPGALSTWNDTHTHAEVMAAFDKAIALAD